MMRRRIADEPYSRLAVWAHGLALFSIPVALLAIILQRGGYLDPIPAVATFAAALVLAAIGILLAFGAFVVIWNEGLRGFGRALLALLIGIVLLAYPAYLVLSSYGLPALVDITTDPADPPRFDVVARIRPREANPLVYPGAAAAALQRSAYPSIEPLVLEVNPLEGYEAALEVVNDRRWRVIDARGPQAGRREGRIEAVVRTPIMGFPDDVVIRVRPDASGTRVDVRSASRYGSRDFGTNAKRVQSLLLAIEEAAGAQPARRR